MWLAVKKKHTAIAKLAVKNTAVIQISSASRQSLIWDNFEGAYRPTQNNSELVFLLCHFVEKWQAKVSILSVKRQVFFANLQHQIELTQLF